MVQLALDCVWRYGFQPGWLSAEMFAGILVSRFRSSFLKMLKANGILITTASRCRNRKVFESPHQSGFYGSVVLSDVLLVSSEYVFRDQNLASQSEARCSLYTLH